MRKVAEWLMESTNFCIVVEHSQVIKIIARNIMRIMVAEI